MTLLRWQASTRLIAATTCLCIGCNQAPPTTRVAPVALPPPETKTEQRPPAEIPSPIVQAARSQIGRTIVYDPAYVGLAYPGGDIPIERGVCTDVVIRALRDALNMDLQKRVHEDMTSAFSAYPPLWGLERTDRNIDHRRVPNLKAYFNRHGYSVAVTQEKGDYLPGDLVTCTVGRNLAHIMIVSDKSGSSGAPLIIHNIGGGTQEEDRLFEFPITGHFRIPIESGTPQGVTKTYAAPAAAHVGAVAEAEGVDL